MQQKYNQIRNKIISSLPKTDCEKLAGLEIFIHDAYPTWDVMTEPFMLFTKGEDEYVGCFTSLDEEQVKSYIIHPPDFFVHIDDMHLVLELDGPIHDRKTSKTSDRNQRYELNNIPYIVVNETDLKDKLGVKKSNGLTQAQINAEFKRLIDKKYTN